jgi:hypothetical protein
VPRIPSLGLSAHPDHRTRICEENNKKLISPSNMTVDISSRPGLPDILFGQLSKDCPIAFTKIHRKVQYVGIRFIGFVLYTVVSLRAGKADVKAVFSVTGK